MDQPITTRGHALGSPHRVLDRGPLAPQIRALSSLSHTKTALAIGREWGAVALVATLAVLSAHPVVYLVAGAFIATRQHAMLILMHEAAHYRLVRSKDWNDTLSDLLLALPNNVMTRRYRARHNLHHRFTNDRNQDPDRQTVMADDQWWFPRPRTSARFVFLRDILGVNAGRLLRVMTHYSPWPTLLPTACAGANDRATLGEAARILLFWSMLALTLSATGMWTTYLLLWVLPSMTVLPALLRLRGISEHEGDVGTDEISVSRHVDASALERVLISPFHIHYHVAHHLFPSVPWYNLPQLHAFLLTVPAYRDRLVTAPSYLGNGGVVDTLMPEAEARTLPV